LIDDRKIGGVLIENQISGNRITGSVLGIGLNINQTAFALSTATSLALATGADYDLNTVLAEVLFSIEGRWLQLKERRLENLNNDYHQKLFRINERHRYQTEAGELFGSITGVDNRGRLMVLTDFGPKTFNNKEIQYLLS
jgi:BirA family biotin operon repressor/biotin-[acetyl-CoA-carboxylase] ligase